MIPSLPAPVTPLLHLRLNKPAQQKQIPPYLFPLPSKKQNPGPGGRFGVVWALLTSQRVGLTLLLSHRKSTTSPRPPPAGTCASTARARSCASRAPSTPACSCRRSTSASSRPSTWRCRSARSWRPSWGSRRPRYGPAWAGGRARPRGRAARGLVPVAAPGATPDEDCVTVPGRTWSRAEPCRAAAGELAPVGPRGSDSGRPCLHLPAAAGLSQPRSLATGPAVPGAGRPWAAGRGEWVFEGDGERQAGGSGAARSQGRSELIKPGKRRQVGTCRQRGGDRGEE